MSWQRWAASYFTRMRSAGTWWELILWNQRGLPVKSLVTGEGKLCSGPVPLRCSTMPPRASHCPWDKPECCPAHCPPLHAGATSLPCWVSCHTAETFLAIAAFLDWSWTPMLVNNVLWLPFIYYCDWHSSKEWISASVFGFKHFKQIWNTLFMLKIIVFCFPGLFFLSDMRFG